MDFISSILCSLATLTCCDQDVGIRSECHLRERPIIIAVIDTGFGIGWDGEENVHLCKFGHKNFVNEKDTSKRFGTVDPVPIDRFGHGTHIAGLIDSYMRHSHMKFCLVILKYYDQNVWQNDVVGDTIKAINMATQMRADFINYSGGGVWPDKKEASAVKKYLDTGGIFVAAAGNEKSDLSIGHYYPAQDDDRIIVVGNGRSSKDRASTSNYGERVNRWENGTNVKMFHNSMTGTSQSAAIATGKIAAKKHFCK